MRAIAILKRQGKKDTKFNTQNADHESNSHTQKTKEKDTKFNTVTEIGFSIDQPNLIYLTCSHTIFNPNLIYLTYSHTILITHDLFNILTHTILITHYIDQPNLIYLKYTYTLNLDFSKYKRCITQLKF